jgi:CRP-like cAMP-binding protein
MGRDTKQASEGEPQIRPLELTESVFHELVELAREIYFFEGMPIDELDWICQRIGFFEFPDGTPIIRQGGPGDSFFLVYKGRALVRVNRGFLRRNLDVATLVRGHVFGEMALVLDEPRSADVVAVGDVQAFVVKRKVFEQVMRDNAHFADAVRDLVTRRTRENDFVKAYT